MVSAVRFRLFRHKARVFGSLAWYRFQDFLTLTRRWKGTLDFVWTLTGAIGENCEASVMLFCLQRSLWEVGGSGLHSKTFQVEPVGEVCVEISKRYEYQAVREELDVQPATFNWISKSPAWSISAGKAGSRLTAVCIFFHSTTGVLEGRTEGLNPANILTAQRRNWGGLMSATSPLRH